MSDDKKNEDYTIELGEQKPSGAFDAAPAPRMPAAPPAAQLNSPVIAILSYCGSSILMTTTNKYVLSGLDFNLNFFLLAVQVSTHTRTPFSHTTTNAPGRVSCVSLPSNHANPLASLPTETSTAMKPKSVRQKHAIFQRTRADLEPTTGFPISVLLIGMIYTSTKALQYLSIPVYTIFKNLTIILIAYGEVLWFGGSVTGMALFSFGLMVLSSVIAAWADIQHALSSHSGSVANDKISTLNSGYIWMMLNCFCSATYVLGMRKRIKLTNFKDFDSSFPVPLCFSRD